MEHRLEAKTAQYEALLADALDVVHLPAKDQEIGAEVLEMATAYLDDGRHFLEHDDAINALAAFSYGHGWIDAGIRCGVLVSPQSKETGGDP